MLKDLEKKYEETENNLNISLNNQARMQLFRQIDSPKQEVSNKADLDFKNDDSQNNNNEDDDGQNNNDDLKGENNDKNNYLADFKIEPIKGKESFMLTSLNRNKLVEENLLKVMDNLDNLENQFSSAKEEKINMVVEEKHCSHQENTQQPKENDYLNTKPIDSSQTNPKDEKNNPNTSVIMNSSKLRLKNLMQNVCDAVNLSKRSINQVEDNYNSKNNKTLSVGFIPANKVFFNEDLEKEINEITRAAENQNNKDEKIANDDHEKLKDEILSNESDDTLKHENQKEKLKDEIRSDESDDSLKHENKKEKFDLVKPEKAAKIRFDEEKNEVMVNLENKERGINNENEGQKSVISEGNEGKENREKMSNSIRSNKHPIPKKKRSSCQNVIFF